MFFLFFLKETKTRKNHFTLIIVEHSRRQQKIVEYFGRKEKKIEQGVRRKTEKTQILGSKNENVLFKNTSILKIKTNEADTKRILFSW